MWKISLLITVVTAVVIRKIWRHKRQCPSSAILHDKTVIITGANSGLGKAAACELAKRKARLILACKNLSSAQETVKELQLSTGNKFIFAKELNLASLKSVRHFCNRILLEEPKINILINNAGVFKCPYSLTEDGFESHMGINHFGHFLLTNLLLERLQDSAPSRVVIVSSSLHKNGAIVFEDINSYKQYNRMKAYVDSKLANLLFARQLAKKVEGSGISVFALHTGMAATNLGRHIVSPWKATLLYPIAVALGLRDAQEGSQPIVYCSVAEELEGKSGVYIDKYFQQVPWTQVASDDHAARKLWKLSEKLTFLS